MLTVRSIKKILGALLTVALIGLATGCGAGDGDASGKVTYKGKPVVCGSVTFVGPNGMTKTARIESDGTYVIRGVGAGRVQVAILSDDPARPLDPYKAAKSHGKEVTEPVDDAARPAINPNVIANPPKDRSNWAEPNVDRTKWFPLPKKYELVMTSGLEFDLKSKQMNEIDISLE